MSRPSGFESVLATSRCGREVLHGLSQLTDFDNHGGNVPRLSCVVIQLADVQDYLQNVLSKATEQLQMVYIGRRIRNDLYDARVSRAQP